MTTHSVVVRLNGEERRVAPGTTLEELLEREELVYGLVAVERNGEPVARAGWAVPLERGDEIHALRLVGGG